MKIKSGKRHKCLVQLDVELKKFNTRLASNLLNHDDVFIATERIESYRDGKNAKQVVAAFCPFCGKELPRT